MTSASTTPVREPSSEGLEVPSPERRREPERAMAEAALEAPRRSTLAIRVLALLGLFSLLPLVLSNVWGYLQSRSLLAAAGLREVRHSAGVAATQLSNLVETDRHELGLLVREDARFLAAVGRAAHCEPVEVCDDTLRELQEILAADVATTDHLRSLTVLSPSGAILASSRAARAAEDDDAVALCFAHSLHTSHVAAARTGDAVDLLIGSPLYEGPSTVGVACGRFRLDLSSLATGTTNVRSLLLDERGQVVATLGGPGPAVPRGDPPRGTERWEGRYESEDDGVVLAAWAPVPELGWGALAEQPLDVALADLDALRTQALLFAALVAIGLMFVASMAANRVTRPLVRVAEAAKRTALGELGVRIPTGEGSREVEEAAHAFNRMSAALKQSHEHLEERIRERTLALARSQEFLELLLNSLDQQVLVVDPSHRIVKANQAALDLYGSDLVGRRLSDVIHDPTGPCPVDLTFETGERQTTERPQRIGQQLEVVRVETYPVLGADGRVEAVLEIDQVVTREKQLRAQMIHQEKMATFGLLAAGIAHDVGNPLAAIHAQLKMTRMHPSPAKTAETLEVVEKEVARMARLLRELVAFARKRRDDVMLLDLNDVVAGVAGLLCHDPRARSVQIDVKTEAGLPPVRAKEDHIVQILMNLGVNALDATSEAGGTLTFATSSSGDEVTIRVTDTGSGVPAGARERLFEPFFTTKPAGHGTGLGLFVSRAISEDLGGKLELESTGPTGTVFVLRVPREPLEGEGPKP